MPIDPSKIRFGDEAGALLRTQHMERAVAVYPITDSEINELRTFDTFATIFWSVGCGFLTFAGGLVFDVSIDMPNAQVTASAYGWAILCGIIGVVFAALAIWATWRKKSAFGRIRQQSTEAPQRFQGIPPEWWGLRGRRTPKQKP